MKLNTSKTLKTLLLMTAVFMATGANAQSITGFCTFITYVKNIIGSIAVLAILMLVINSFFSKNSLMGDIIQTVLIGCVVAIAAVALIQGTGLTVSCT